MVLLHLFLFAGNDGGEGPGDSGLLPLLVLGAFDPESMVFLVPGGSPLAVSIPDSDLLPILLLGALDPESMVFPAPGGSPLAVSTPASGFFSLHDTN